MKKICIVGTHGCGKSTLSYSLGAFYKRMGYNTQVMPEMARRCPFPLNRGFTIQGAQWIVHSLIAEELTAIGHGYTLLICDRSPLDTVMYARSKELDVCNGYTSMAMCALDWMNSYDQIIWIAQPLPVADGDGIRCTDTEWRNNVHEHFACYFSNHTSFGSKLYLVKQESIFNDPNICVDINRYGINWSSSKHMGVLGGIPSMGDHGLSMGCV